MKRSSWIPKAVNISVVVPAYNEEDNIERLLGSLLAQDLRTARLLEVVVIASGCTDDTEAIARKLSKGRPGVHVHVQAKREGKVAAINSFLRMRDERADILVICGADLLLAPNVLEQLAVAFQKHPMWGMVGARPIPDNAPRDVVGRMVTLLWELHHRVALHAPKMGELVAFRSNLIDSVSELSVVDEASIENVVRQKGFELGYVPEAVVTNHGPETLPEYFEQRRRIARGHYWLDFAFGYRVATLDKKVLLGAARSVWREQDRDGKLALAAAVATEVAARAAGFWDARLRGGKHRTWQRLASTKRVGMNGAPTDGASTSTPSVEAPR